MTILGYTFGSLTPKVYPKTFFSWTFSWILFVKHKFANHKCEYLTLCFAEQPRKGNQPLFLLNLPTGSVLAASKSTSVTTLRGEINHLQTYAKVHWSRACDPEELVCIPCIVSLQGHSPCMVSLQRHNPFMVSST